MAKDGNLLKNWLCDIVVVEGMVQQIVMLNSALLWPGAQLGVAFGTEAHHFGVCPSARHTTLPTSPPGFWGALSGHGAHRLATTCLCNTGCICLLLPDCGNLQIIAKSASLIGLWCICTDG